MARQPQQPQSTDAILGNQIKPPVTGAVLGGLEGLQQRFLHLDPNQKLEVMPGILELGEPGIDLLIAALSDDAVTVRYEAYRYLQHANSAKAKSPLSTGIPLKPGDTLYCVYEIPIGYDDENYYLCTAIPEDILPTGEYPDCVVRVHYKDTDWESLDPEEFDSLMDEWETPKLVSRHLLKEPAEEVAELLHQKNILDPYTPNLFELDWVRTQEFNVSAWRMANGLPPAQQPWKDWWELGPQLVEELKTQQQIELLSKLWKDTAGRLAVVHEQRIKRDSYFKVTRSL